VRRDPDRTLPLELSVLIPTQDRVPSLERTLKDLAAPSPDARVEVVVVDNGPLASADLAQRALRLFPAVRVLHEPRAGKAQALNRAIAAGGLAPLVAVLDDDMAPEPGWCAAAIDACARRPRFDVFGGRSYVVWPEGVPRPSWTDDEFARGLQLSVIDLGERDRVMGQGVVGFPSGNHFWFRRSVLGSVARFPETWAPEIEFVVWARRAGHAGVFVPEVRCGHRVQPALFDATACVERAAKFGAILGRIDALGTAPGTRRRTRILAAVVRSCASALRSRLVAACARLLPAGRGVPLRARAACSVARQRVRMRASWAEWTTA
jgi:GT2 family glycosyltransferase